MRFSHAFAFVLAAAGLAAMVGETASQALPPPYSYPPGGYRGVPDKDGVMTVDPDDDDQVERVIPPRRQPYLFSNPYDPRGDSAVQPVDPRYDRDGLPYPPDPRARRQAAPSQELIPATPQDRVLRRPYGAMPPYDERGAGVSTGRPDDMQPAVRAPGAIESRPLGPIESRPPVVIESRPPAVIESRPPALFEPRPPAPIETARPPANIAPPAAAMPGRPVNLASLPPEDQPEEDPAELPPQFRRQIVSYQTKEPAGTIVIDTPSTFLYYVNGDGTAVRYGIGVGRDGFTWAGTEKISRMAEWPDWHPPAEMIERQPYLPRFMAGGPGNPLGARALYLGKTVYRIHGTNQPSTIGKFVSSGCIRMLNEDVEDLYGRVKLGSKVVVLASRSPSAANVPSAR
jgi:lipoprotein-anchoring transpeptidase ErfK/SrfK